MDAANDALARRNDYLGREFQHSYSWLTTNVHRIVGSRNDAEDLAASAFTELAAFDDLHGVRQPRALLTTIARRLTFEFWRRRDLERAWLAELAARPEPCAPSAEEVCLSLQEVARIDAALVRLPPRVREAVVLGHVEEWPHARIADRLGASVSMIRKYLAQAAHVCRQAA